MTSLSPSSTISTTEVRVGAQVKGAIRRRAIERSRGVVRGRSVDRCGGDIGAAIEGRADRTAEIRPVIDRESNSYAGDSYMAKTGADISLRITFGSDEAAGYDGGEDK